MKQVITEAKRKKIAKALHDTGTISKIKYIAVGSGGVDENNEVLSPSETSTALKHELKTKCACCGGSVLIGRHHTYSEKFYYMCKNRR